jgi:hypothetical protein
MVPTNTGQIGADHVCKSIMIQIVMVPDPCPATFMITLDQEFLLPQYPQEKSVYVLPQI